MIANFQELAQTLFEEAGDALFLFDPDDGRLVEVNPTAQKFCGLSRPALLKESVNTLFRSEVHGDVARLRRAYRNTGVFHSQDGFFLRQQPSGGWLPVNLTVARLHVRPKTVGLITARDVSERLQSEMALRDSESRNRAVLESALDCIISIDHQGSIIEFNPAAERTFGYSRMHVLGRQLADLIVPARFRDQHRQGLARYLRERTSAILDRRIEVFALRADGSEFPAELTVTAVQSRSTPVFTAFLRDITEQKRAEAAQRVAERRLQHVVTSSPVVLFTLGLDSSTIRGITWISANIREMLGHEVEDAFAPEWWSSNIHPEDRERIVAHVQAELFSTGRTLQEYRFWHRSGEYRWVQGEIRLIRDGDGVPIEGVGSWSDISGRKLLEDQFRQAQKMEAVGRLAGGIAHDFNNLLTVITGFSELLENLVEADDQARPLVEEIGKAGKRAAALTRQLLAFSRKQVLQPKIIDLNALVRDLAKMLPRLLGEDIELNLSLLDSGARIRADPGQLEQVIVNLAVNGRDAMPTGGTLTIETQRALLEGKYAEIQAEVRPGPYVLLSVRDTGTGMDSRTLARVFEPFFTTKGPDRGTGLGLATVFGIVKQSGGHIEACSELGFGTTFRLYLPAHDEMPLAVAAGTPNRSECQGGCETVLLVEDEIGVRGLTRHLLNLKGYKVIEAGDGEEALAIAAEHRGAIDLVLTDVVMPRMSGREFTQRLNELRPGIKVLYMSGYTDDAVVRHGIYEESVNFLQKPFSPFVLTQRVRDILDSSPGLSLASTYSESGETVTA
jgi:two-component system, cell cycle sensor histidine kinase and response regulator CckA